MSEAGALRDWRIGLVFGSGAQRCLTLLDTEEICGRFGSFRRIESLYIALLGDGVCARVA